MRGLRLIPVLALVAAAGCNEYHYYDLDVSFNIASGQFAGTNEISTIQRCIMTVSGADSATITLGPANGCPPMTAAGIGTRMGIVLQNLDRGQTLQQSLELIGVSLADLEADVTAPAR